MTMGNSASSSSPQQQDLSFVIKYRHHRSTLNLPSNTTISQLKHHISKLSPEHPGPDSQRIIGLVRDLRRELPDEATLGQCDAVREGRKNLIQVLKIKSRRERQQEQTKMQQQLSQNAPDSMASSSSARGSMVPLTPQQVAENKFIRTREIIQQSRDQLAKYTSIVSSPDKYQPFLKQIDENLIKEMLGLDALEICYQQEDFRKRRKELLREIQILQSELDKEMKKL